MTIFDGAWNLAKGAVNGVGDIATSAWDIPGDLAKDFGAVGRNKYKNETYQPNEIQYGGQYGADGIAKAGFDRMDGSMKGAAWAQGQAERDRGPQAFENQDLSDRESASKYGDQSGAMQLAREAAMGQAPSAAAYQMQAGLDRGLANQQAMVGGARGAAGMAMAGSNAAATGAAMQNQAYTSAGQLRAEEMASGRQLYGGLAGQSREQDLNRLQMGNQMSQFNSSQNDNYRLGMGNLANQGNQTGAAWYSAAQNPYNQQGNMDMGRENIAANSYDAGQAREAGVAQANSDAKKAQNDRLWSFGTTALGVGGSAVAAQGKPKT